MGALIVVQFFSKHRKAFITVCTSRPSAAAATSEYAIAFSKPPGPFNHPMRRRNVASKSPGGGAGRWAAGRVALVALSDVA